MTKAQTASVVMGNWRGDLSALYRESICSDTSPPDWDDVVLYKDEFERDLLRLDLDYLAGPAGLAVDQMKLVADGHWSADLADAIHRIGTDMPSGALHYYRSHQLMGWTKQIAGTVFEQKVFALAQRVKSASPQALITFSWGRGLNKVGISPSYPRST